MSAMPNRAFTKPILTLPEQIALLEKRGLVITDRAQAEHYLKYIGYYRFSGYLHPFKQPDDSYVQGTTFEQILDMYIFDRKLRLLTFDAIERIEVALRSCITKVVGEKYGTHWFNDQTLFEKPGYHQKIDKIIRDVSLDAPQDKRDVFIRHYYDTYSLPLLPPSWMVFEALSMGAVSLTLRFLHLDIRKEIAKEFGIDEKVLVSWIHALVYTHNLCAHHSRLWNRVFTIKPIAMKRYKSLLMPTDKFHAQAAAIQILFKAIAPQAHWQDHLKQLLREHSNIDTNQMGFSKNWSGFGI